MKIEFNTKKISDNFNKIKDKVMEKAKDMTSNVQVITEDKATENGITYNNTVYVDEEFNKHKEFVDKQQQVIDKLDLQLQNQIKARVQND